MGDTRTTTVWLKAALPTLVVGTVLQAIGVGTRKWQVSMDSDGESSSIGLWETCVSASSVDEVCQDISLDKYSFHQADALRATRAFEILAVLLLGLLCISIPLYMLLDVLAKGITVIVMAAMAFFSAGGIFLGIVVYDAWLVLFPYTVSASLIVCAVADLFAAAAGILLLAEFKSQFYKKEEAKYCKIEDGQPTCLKI